MRKLLPILARGIAGGALVAMILPDLEDDPAADRVDQMLARWAREYDDLDLFTRTPVPLAYVKGFSERFTSARGKVEIDFETGGVEVRAEGLEPPRPGSRYEVWLVDNLPGPNNNAAIDLGEGGDRILNVGVLPQEGSLTALAGGELATMEVDLVAVMRVADGGEPAFVIGGMQSVILKLGRRARLERAEGVLLLGPGGVPGPPAGGSGSGKAAKEAIARGRELFLNGTFGGNGRTCGTCHPAGNNFLIDKDFIATLPAGDPLFLLSAALPAFDPLDPQKPAFEDPALMHSHALILENINGFGTDATTGKLLVAPVFRAPPTMFNLEFTSPFGLSGGFVSLKTFAIGAVVQHFPKTLARVPGTDFVIPTDPELTDMELFMLSLHSPADGNFALFGGKSVLSTRGDRTAVDTTREVIRGRDRFFSVGCSSCHTGTVLAGGNRNTGVENLPAKHTPTDIGDGGGGFQTPQLFALRKPAFFHNNAIGNNTVPIAGRTLLFTNLRAAVAFYESAAFKASPTGGQVGLMSDQDKDDIAAFLEALAQD